MLYSTGLLYFPPPPVQTFLISSFYYSLIFISSPPELCRKSSGSLMHFSANSRLARTRSRLVAPLRGHTGLFSSSRVVLVASVSILWTVLFFLSSLRTKKKPSVLRCLLVFASCWDFQHGATFVFRFILIPPPPSRMTDLCRWHFHGRKQQQLALDALTSWAKDQSINCVSFF